MRRAFSLLGRCVVALAVLLAAGWGALVVHYCGPASEALRILFVGVLGLTALAFAVAILIRRRRKATLALYALSMAGVTVLWSTMTPSNERDWQTDVARLAFAEIDGDRVILRNIRNFSYTSELEYTPAYYDRSFDLKDLTGVDLVAVYWMGPAIAHVFVSFEFRNGEHFAISIETRKERNESYSTVRGFFRQYELYYVVADERDVIGLRTNYRKDPPEDVYVYRMHAPIENGRRLLLSYLERLNSLRARPEFYNTLTSNCTTNIWLHSLVNAQHVPLSWKVLASGYVPQFLYEQGRLDRRVAFEDLRQQAYVNPRAQAIGAPADFSRRIREAAGAARN